VFQIFFVVIYSFMDYQKHTNVNKFTIPTTKHSFKGGMCENFQGVNFVVY